MDPLASRVALRFSEQELLSREFPNEEALKKYLQDHPKADKTKHRVKPTKEEKAEGKKKEKDEQRKKDDDAFNQSLRDVMKEKGISEKQVHEMIDKKQKDFDSTSIGDYGEKEKKKKKEDAADQEFRDRLKEEGISKDDVKKWLEKQKQAAGDPIAGRVAARFLVDRIAAGEVNVKTAGEVSEALKKALGEIDYLPNAVAAWMSAHGQNKALASENAKKVRQAEDLLGEVLASLPAGKEYEVNGIGKFMTVDHLIKGLAQHGIKHTGFSDRGGRPEMRGAPTFDKLVGPIYGGPGVVRYETAQTYEMLSR